MHRNFCDPGAPYNDEIVQTDTWKEHYKTDEPEQYNEIYRYISGEKNEECVKERANEKECDVEVEQIANIAIKKSLLDVPSQCVRYIQDIALELLNNQKLSSTDVKQLFSSER